MRIITWNIERPALQSRRLPLIVEQLAILNADIIILTESSSCIEPGELYYSLHSTPATEAFYTAGEFRVSIFSKYKIIKQIPTFRSDTSICVLLATPDMPLAIYGTVIGVTGNRAPGFQEDLDLQITDYRTISKAYKLCIAGDFNLSFSDNYYFTQLGRNKLISIFNELDLENTTAAISNNIDHIVLNRDMLSGKYPQTFIWNEGKELSDHLGVGIDIIQ